VSKILKKIQSDPKIYQNSSRTRAHLVELASRNPQNFRATCLTSKCTRVLQQNVYILLWGHLNDLWPKDLCNNRVCLPSQPGLARSGHPGLSLGVRLTETDRFGSSVLRIIRLPEKKNRSVTLKTRNRGISVSGNSVRFRF